MKEEFTRILTANNPHAPSNIVRYSFKVIWLCLKFVVLKFVCDLLFYVGTELKCWMGWNRGICFFSFVFVNQHRDRWGTKLISRQYLLTNNIIKGCFVFSLSYFRKNVIRQPQVWISWQFTFLLMGIKDSWNYDIRLSLVIYSS